MGACSHKRLFRSIFILCVQRTHSTAVYEIRLTAFFADNLMNSVARCGGFYLRDIVEEKCRLRPACRKLPGLNREKTRISPRLSETSGAQQRKNMDFAPLVGNFRGSAEKKHGFRPACQELPGLSREKKSSPNLCVHSSSSYVSPSMLPLSSGDLIEWSLVCHSTLSYQKFCDRHSNHYDHPEELHQSVE